MALGALEISRRRVLPARAASAIFWRAAGDGAAVKNDSTVRRVRVGNVDLVLELPLKYRQNWAIAFGQRALQDRVALDVFAHAAVSARAIFDVGMNAGSYLYTAVGHRHPDVPIIGFEPDEQMAAAVRSNVERNALSNVAIETCAVSATSGTAQLYRAPSDQMHTLEPSFLERVGTPIVGQEQVRTISLDDAAAQRNVSPDLIKIDVEGHEEGVIRGASSILDRLRPTLVIELGERSADGALFAELIERGYSGSLLGETVIPLRSHAEFLSSRGRGFENYMFRFHGR